MLLISNGFRELDFEKLMDVYVEGNRLNGEMKYPNESSKMQLQLAELDFEAYLRQDFFTTANACYCIWTEEGEYLSALRLEPYLDGYLLCALETKPSCRERGCAKCLIQSVLDAMKPPIYSHISKDNIPSIKTHLASGFLKLKDGARYLDGSVNANADTYIFIK